MSELYRWVKASAVKINFNDLYIARVLPDFAGYGSFTKQDGSIYFDFENDRISESDFDKIELLEKITPNKEGQYWKKRCEAAELVMSSFPREVIVDQAGEDYHDYEQLKSTPPNK